MTKAGKKRFIRDLIKNTQGTILANIDKMPNEWDGIELRQYIADKFSESIYVPFTGNEKMRRREYKNEVLVRNL